MKSEQSSIGIRIERARKASGLSLRALGEEVGISHTALSKYEQGTVIPSSSMLIKLSRALGVRIEYFLRPATYELSNIEYRKRPSRTKAELSAIEFDVMDQIERQFELESLLPLPEKKIGGWNCQPSKKVTIYSDIEEIACEARSNWCLGASAISNFVEIVKEWGVRIVFTKVATPGKFDGLSAMIGDTHLIVVANNVTGDRQRFTIAHELGHLILDDRISSELDIEKACNRFAGAFLLPRNSVIERLGRSRKYIDIAELSFLKAEFGISMVGILYRALDLEIISREFHREMTSTFIENGWNKVEPGKQYPAESDYAFQQQIFRALSEEYIGISKAAELLGVSIDEFNLIHDLTATWE